MEVKTVTTQISTSACSQSRVTLRKLEDMKYSIVG
jgi:hypothetical protein